MFNKDSGRYLQLVVSASRDLTNLSRNEIIDIAIGDLRLYFPRVKDATLLKAHVIKEQRATFSAAPETESLRPTPEAGLPKSFPRGRLDADRLARHHGGRGPQRLPGRRRRGAGSRQARRSSSAIQLICRGDSGGKRLIQPATTRAGFRAA